jgi:hypothetical protein
MPSVSIIGAFIERYESLGFSERPDIFFGEAPARKNGATVVPPYVVVRDNGTSVEHTFETPIETGLLEVDVFASTLAGLDRLLIGIRFNNQPPSVSAGMDRSQLEMVQGSVVCLPKRFSYTMEGPRNDSADPVYKCTMSYEVVTFR